MQLEVHMNSNQHKMNHPIAPMPVADPYPVQNNQQLFNFESSSYGYGFRNWQGEQHMFNRDVPQLTQTEMQKQQEMERERRMVDQAKTELMARFPFYALNIQNNEYHPPDESQFNPDDIPMPVEAPKPVEAPSPYDYPQSSNNFNYC